MGLRPLRCGALTLACAILAGCEQDQVLVSRFAQYQDAAQTNASNRPTSSQPLEAAETGNIAYKKSDRIAQNLKTCPAGSAFRVQDFGAVPDGRTDSTLGVSRALECALASTARPVEVTFEAGTYFLGCAQASGTACLKIIGSAAAQTPGFRVRGHASRTQIRIGNPDTGFLFVQNVPGFEASNLTIDYDVVPFTQGTITAVNADSFDFVAEAGARAIPDTLCAAFGKGADGADSSPELRGHYPGSSFGTVMDSKNGRLIKRHSLPGSAIHVTWCQRLAPAKWRLGTKSEFLPYIQAGDRYVQLIGRDHNKSAFWIDGTRDATLENIQVRAAGGMPALLTQNSGTLRVRGLEVRFAPGSTRYLTTDCDGIHLQHNWATPIIENSYFEGMADDGINNYAVANYAADTASGGASLEIKAMRPVRQGDWIEVLAPSTGTLRGAAAVLSVTPHATKPGYAVLALDRPIPGVQGDPTGDKGDIVFDASAGGPGAIIRNNTFGRHRGRGIVNHSPQSLIEGNLFSDIHWSAIELSADFSWHEGPTAHSVTIRNNQMVGGDLPWGAQIQGYGAALQGVPQYGPTDITVQNNRFTHAPAPAVDLRSAYLVNIRNNHMVGSTCPRAATAGIALRDTSGSTIAGNLQTCASKAPVIPGPIGVAQGGSLGGDFYYGPDAAGAVDAVDGTGLSSGWAVDGLSAAQSTSVHFYLDGPYGTGIFAGAAMANAPSPDLATAGFTGSHRFSYRLPATTHGWHTLFVYGIRVNPNGGVAPFLMTPRGVSFYLP